MILMSVMMVLCLSVMAMPGELMWPSMKDDVSNWRVSKYGKWEQDEKGDRVLKVHVPTDCKDKTSVLGGSFKLDLKKYRGKMIEFSIETKHVNLTKPSKTWLGFKFMLEYVDGFGVRNYPGGGTGVGTPTNTDWRVVLFTVKFDEGVESGNLCLGMQNVTGTAWFKNLRIREVEMFKDVAPLPEGFKCEYSDNVKNLQVLRGAMSPGLNNGAKAEDLAELSRWGANVIRWQINFPRGVNQLDPEAIRKVYKDHLAKLDVHIPQLRKDGLYVIFDFHGVPGGRVRATAIAGTAGSIAGNVAVDGNHFTMFHKKEYLDLFIEMWEMVARHYKDEPIVIGYDLYNEPVQSSTVPYDYLYCQYEAAKAIRRIDPEKIIYVASNNWNSASTFSYLKPLPLKNIVYQVHMYVPGAYTHQGVGGNNMKRLKDNPSLIKAYPGNFDGMFYDKEMLRKVLQPVRDFQNKYGARIYMGEFSAIRFAPGADQYIDDVISLAEEYGWDWSYHAFREWFNWSVEYDENIHNNKPATEDTPRKKVLLKYFKRNKITPID